jgi:hypothetical protein
VPASNGAVLVKLKEADQPPDKADVAGLTRTLQGIERRWGSLEGR